MLVPDNEHYTLKKRLFFKLQKGPFGCKVTPQLYIETVESGVEKVADSDSTNRATPLHDFW